MSIIQQDADISIIRTVQTERVIVRQLPAPGPQGPPGEFPISVQTELEIDEMYPSNHKEIVYNDGQVTQVNTWDSVAKNFQIFSKVFEYNSLGKVSRVITTLLLDGAQMVKTMTRDTNNKIISVDRTYTP